ncbi:MAG: hypothetical protein A3F72_15575 [Bacteroidetes bacterium RIFCSPLOWO2_12_FULL_35_15]|nr:MAG: hypothetical protein A3F72_15575 [Bacteroidetes bacterium RIFCSPLOWO2_12_FULL_35_15]
MKKALIAVFSISLTAGTLYLTYSQVKSMFINKLVKSWIEEAKKQKKELSEGVIKQIKEELDRLYLWEVKYLMNYSSKVLGSAPKEETEPLLMKLKEKKITEKADLKAVAGIIPFSEKVA